MLTSSLNITATTRRVAYRHFDPVYFDVAVCVISGVRKLAYHVGSLNPHWLPVSLNPQLSSLYLVLWVIRCRWTLGDATVANCLRSSRACTASHGRHKAQAPLLRLYVDLCKLYYKSATDPQLIQPMEFEPKMTFRSSAGHTSSSIGAYTLIVECDHCKTMCSSTDKLSSGKFRKLWRLEATYVNENVIDFEKAVDKLE